MSNKSFLIKKSKWLRKEIFEMVTKVNQGHIASSFSQCEIVISLFYGSILKYKKNNANYENRDRVIVSKGHSAMGTYPILADLGYFSKTELKKYGTPKGLLRIYGDKSIPGIDATSGSLSQAPGIACGFCIAAKHDKKNIKSFDKKLDDTLVPGLKLNDIDFDWLNSDEYKIIEQMDKCFVAGDTFVNQKFICNPFYKKAVQYNKIISNKTKKGFYNKNW